MLCNGYENKSGKKVREPGAGVRGPGSGGRGPGAGVRPSRVFFRRPCVSPFCYRFASVAALTRESPPLSPPTRAAPHRAAPLPRALPSTNESKNQKPFWERRNVSVDGTQWNASDPPIIQTPLYTYSYMEICMCIIM